MQAIITDHQTHIARLDAEIAQFEALRHTDQEPPALDALVTTLRRKREWHQTRLTPPVPNTGTASLFEKGGHSQRKHGARRNRGLDVPVVDPSQLPPGA